MILFSIYEYKILRDKYEFRIKPLDYQLQILSLICNFLIFDLYRNSSLLTGLSLFNIIRIERLLLKELVNCIYTKKNIYMLKKTHLVSSDGILNTNFKLDYKLDSLFYLNLESTVCFSVYSAVAHNQQGLYFKFHEKKASHNPRIM